MKNPIAIYQQRLNLQSATFFRIDHDDAMVADVYKITHPNGTHLILKICSHTNHYLREFYFLNYFADKLPVPRIIQAIEPEANLPGAILMEYVPGTLLTIPTLSNALSYEMGSLLARIHTNRASGYGDLIDPNDLNPDPRPYFIEKFHHGFDECKNHLPKDLLDQSRHYLENHINLLDLADGPCITHRDFRPGNLIAHDGKVQGIIDWSSARASFAQEDFCSMEHGVWPINPASKEPFLAGYAAIRSIPDYKTIMPLLRLNKAIATIGFLVKRKTWNTNGKQLYQFNRHYLETLF